MKKISEKTKKEIRDLHLDGVSDYKIMKSSVSVRLLSENTATKRMTKSGKNDFAPSGKRPGRRF